MTRLGSILIVGASLAGLRCAQALWKLGLQGRVTVVGREAHAPYDRPPLLKEPLSRRRAAGELSIPGRVRSRFAAWQVRRVAQSLVAGGLA